MIHPVRQVSIGASYAGLIGKLDYGEYLPYMPAQKVEPEIRWESLPNAEGRKGFAFLITDFVFQQDKLNGQETNTPSYTLLNAGIGMTLEKGQFRYDISLTGNNSSMRHTTITFPASRILNCSISGGTSLFILKSH
jgi:iron complex outermembrane receptor protein